MRIEQDLVLGGDLVATQLWAARAPGRSAHRVFIRGHAGSVYVSDGWGVNYASIRFRRLDAMTGEEAASFRSGTAVRTFAYRDTTDDLLIATDTKLFELDSLTLSERRRWNTRIPRYPDSLAVRGDHVVVANWLAPQVGLVDLATGRVRRRAAPGMTKILDGAGSPLLVGGLDGDVVSIDPISGRTEQILATPPALDAGLSPDRRTLWLSVGVRATVTSSGMRLGRPTRELRRYALDGSEPAETYRAPHPFRNVAIGTSALWLVGERLVDVPFPLGTGPARMWSPPEGETIVDGDPDSGLVMTLLPGKRDPDARLTCFRAVERDSRRQDH